MCGLGIKARAFSFGTIEMNNTHLRSVLIHDFELSVGQMFLVCLVRLCERWGSLCVLFDVNFFREALFSTIEFLASFSYFAKKYVLSKG